ncbi:MAG: RagB/SusD family nutrient uptake outer membrane protein [Muribaculaceae bacterium]
MKKIIYSLIAITLISLSSCQDYFDGEHKGNVEDEVFYKNINNLRFALNSAFNIMQSERYQQSEILFGESISDNCWNAQDISAGDVSDIINFTFNTDNPYILSRYKVNYDGINIVNQIIRSIPYVEFNENMIQNQREIRMIYGQAKTLRALFYFNLVKTFGGVSIQPEVQNLKDLVVPRSTLDETYAYIEKDLRESILILEKSRYQTTDAGQLDAGAGLGLLLKTLLYQASKGTPLVKTDKSLKLKEANEIGKYFIEGKDISVKELLKFDERYADKETWEQFANRMFLPKEMTLETLMLGVDVANTHALYDFDRLFRINGKFNVESLIEINHYDYSGSGSSVNESWPINGYINSPANTTILYSVPTKDLFDQFNNDPRKLFTVTDRNMSLYFREDNGVNINPQWNFSIGNMLQFTKYYVFPSEGSTKSRSYIVMRYAEALLNYAEILNESGETERAIEMVNKVKARAKKLFDSSTTGRYQTSTPANFKLLTAAPYDIVRDAILKEKRVEMAGEFDRWFELGRLGQIPDRMLYLKNNNVADADGTRYRGKYFRKGVNEIFPIPQKEVFISNGVITQNFGY